MKPDNRIASLIALLIVLAFVVFIGAAVWPDFKMEDNRLSTLATIIGNPLMLILGFYFGSAVSAGQRRQSDFTPPAPPAQPEGRQP